MKVAVRFFARYREAAGRDHVELELPEGGTVEAAWEAVASRFPVLQPYRPFTLFALGTDYDELHVFGRELAPTQRRFAVAETLSHLERLVQEGRAARSGDDNRVFYTSP